MFGIGEGLAKLKEVMKPYPKKELYFGDRPAKFGQQVTLKSHNSEGILIAWKQPRQDSESGRVTVKFDCVLVVEYMPSEIGAHWKEVS